jgi:hypothetical protein
MSPVCVGVLAALCVGGMAAAADVGPRPWVTVRGIYGGMPEELMREGMLTESGVNAVWLGSGAVTHERLALLRKHGVKVFAEFNTLHDASYLQEHPEAAPVGPDGTRCPPPHGWQGVAPTHNGYRRYRMAAFRTLLAEHEIDGVWLDYHHAMASWERADPALPDTGFEPYSLEQFQRATGIRLPQAPVPELARALLTKHRTAWVRWRCGVLTDWVREFREIIDETRPGALLGTFHCPWSETDLDGALRGKLNIDLRAQRRYIDVFSPMPYHVRFGHAGDVAWVSRQVEWLGRHLKIEGKPGERHRIWPIVQLSDWDDPVPLGQVRQALDHGTRRPATGVMIFNWGSARTQPEKIDEMTRFYVEISPQGGPLPPG